jgi:hypothetical protein
MMPLLLIRALLCADYCATVMLLAVYTDDAADRGWYKLEYQPLLHRTYMQCSHSSAI